MDDYLTIGSIVKLKDDSFFEYMIMGYFPIDQDTEEKYDYSAVVYPHGYTYGDNIFLFNKSDIEEVLYKGYSDKDTELVLSKVFEELEKQGAKEEK